MATTAKKKKFLSTLETILQLVGENPRLLDTHVTSDEIVQLTGIAVGIAKSLSSSKAKNVKVIKPTR